MANHVYHYITVEGNEAVQKEWTKLFPHYGELVERPSYHGDGTIQMWEYHEIQKHPFLEGYEEDNWYNWGCENIGAKWAHIEDADEFSSYIVSAWSPVIPYLESLYFHLIALDTDVLLRCNYEDEFRNFIGTWFNGDYEEIDGEELREQFETKYKCDLSSDEFDWSGIPANEDSCYDELFDILVHDWFDNV
jgi:hypothetical protein